MLFDDQSVHGARIKEDNEYEGVRVTFKAGLAGARIPMQVDIGFGDAVYPGPEFASFPVLLSMDPRLSKCEGEYAQAEKAEGALEEGANAFSIQRIKLMIDGNAMDFLDCLVNQKVKEDDCVS